MSKFKNVLAYEPALAAAVGQIVVAFIIAKGWHLTTDQTGSIEAAVAAVGALIVAASTRPFQVQAIAGLITVGGTLLAAFAADFPATTVSFVNAILAALMLVIHAQRVTPVAALRGERALPEHAAKA